MAIRRSSPPFQRRPATTQSAVFSGLTFTTAERSPARYGSSRRFAITPSRPIASNASSHSSASGRARVYGERTRPDATFLEGRPPIGERRAPVLDPVPDEHVEGDEARRDLRGQLANPALRRVEPRLHRVEVEDAVADDHDLAVEARAGREQLAERHELGEVAEERPRVPRPEAKLAGGVLEEAAEAVPLRLVLPLVAVRELTHELGFHRGERNCGIEVGGPLDGLARPAPAGTCHRGHRTAE